MDGQPASPPGRKVVLVRAGPSKKKPLIVDGVFGVLGAVLIIMAALLVNILPDDVAAQPQYRVQFGGDLPPSADSVPSEDRFLQEGETAEFTIQVPDHNVYRVQAVLYLEEDQPATYPDRFTAELEAPNGTVYAFQDGAEFTTIPVVPAEADPTRPSTFYVQDEEAPALRTLSFNIRGVPADAVIAAEPGTELFEVREAVRQQYYVEETIGAWTFRVTLVDAGDCPATDPASPDAQRGVECRLQNAADGATDPATDNGNNVRLSQRTYSWYDLTVSEA